MLKIPGGRNILFLIIAQCISAISDRLLLVGITWYIIQNYSNSVLACFLTITLSPHLIMVLFSPKIINKITPINSIIYAELGRTCVYLLTIMLTSLNSNHTLFILTTGLLIGNTASAILNPAFLMLPRQLLINLNLQQRALGLLNSGASLARLVGPMLAIPLYGLIDIKGIFIFCCIIYLIAWLCELEIKVDPDIINAQNKLVNEHRQFVGLVKKYFPVMVLLFIFFIMNIFVIPIQLFMPIIAKWHYHSNIVVLSLFEAALGVGILIGSLYISLIPSASKAWEKIPLPYLLSAFAYLLLPLATLPITTMIILAAFGFLLAIGNVVTLHYLQSNTSLADLADIMSYVNFISIASAPVAMSLAGFFLNTIAPTELIALYGIMYLAFCAALYYSNYYKLHNTFEELAAK
jgi:MFS transporter, DHA3 family, macrolide efflux protein